MEIKKSKADKNIVKTEMQTIKKDPQEGQFLNGGTDASRFELLERYRKHLFSTDITKICHLITKLKLIA